MSVSENDLIVRCRNSYLRDAGQEFDDQFSVYGESCCESPIERVLVAAIIAKRLPQIHFCEPDHAFVPGMSGHFVFVQPEVGPYRADLVIITVDGTESRCLVVECDGHDFHERTKDQAQRDRKRDRDMIAHGYQVIRFTGSEIWADPYACADEILQHARRPLAQVDAG